MSTRFSVVTLKAKCVCVYIYIYKKKKPEKPQTKKTQTKKYLPLPPVIKVLQNCLQT